MNLLRIFVAFLERTLNLQFSQKKKKNKHQRLSISEVIDSKVCAYLNA